MSRSSPPSRSTSDAAPIRAEPGPSQHPGQAEGRQSARPLKPLGTARRPTRSKTPTPGNPHPHPGSERPTFATTSRPGGSPSLLGEIPSHSPFPASPGRSTFDSQYAGTSTSSSSKQRSSSSGSVSVNQERRPWFPFPANPASTKALAVPTHPDRRTSNTSAASSTSSSASSYNSAELTSLFARRASSAEPEEWSQAISRGRPLTRMPSESVVPGKAISEECKGQVTATLSDEVDRRSSGTSSTDDEKERAHFQSVLKAFDTYLAYSLAANNARRRSFYSLPRSHRLLLSSLGSTLPGPVLDGVASETGIEHEHTIAGGRGFKARLDEIDDRIRRNADVLAQIVADSRGFLGDESGDDAGKQDAQSLATTEQSSIKQEKEKTSHDSTSAQAVSDGSKSSAGSSGTTRRERKRVTDHEVDKVRSTIKQFVRDWSEEGVREREAAYGPILDALEMHFSTIASAQRGQVRVLVPGAGLGRLAFEIAWLGFSCQGNEFSFYMLLASHFVLNKTMRINQHVIYPFVHSSSNWRHAKDMLRPVRIPDINPSDLPSHVDFSMVAGEFVEVYSKEQERGAWDAIATCFFIDTAHNFARYLEVINQILPKNGLWINVGPLLWHYEGGASQGDISIELTLEEALGLIELMGFKIESQRTLSSQAYTGNPFSMLVYEYSPEFWVARKVRDVTPASSV